MEINIDPAEELKKNPDRIDVMFCLPGNNFSGKFLDSWSALLLHCIRENINFGMSRATSPSLPHVRNLCIGGHPARGRKQKPFNGLPIERFMWIDSDIVFSPAQFMRLYKSDKDVVSGLYMMEGRTGYCAWEKLDDMYYKVHGRYKNISVSDLKDKTDLIPVEYIGMGFVCTKASVFDKMDYPWFKLGTKQIGKSYEQTFEDFQFCKDLLNNGHKMYVDPNVIVGHEKRIVI